MFRREGQEGWVVDRFNTSVPMSTYQVAFVVSELGYLNCTMQRDVQIRGTVPSFSHLICPYVIFTTSRNITLQHTVNSCGMCFIYFCTYILKLFTLFLKVSRLTFPQCGRGRNYSRSPPTPRPWCRASSSSSRTTWASRTRCPSSTSSPCPALSLSPSKRGGSF